jgi:tRNA1(Val) A37 N6-methylase TrmN6
MTAEAVRISEDGILDGRLVLRQPRRGHRVGHDAILLAAATGGHAGERAIDLGAGVGAAGLALAQRIGGMTVTLIDIDPALIGLARENAERNGLSARVTATCLDVAASVAAFATAGLAAGCADRVLMNPPFNSPQKTSPDHGRRRAYVAAPGSLQRWVHTAVRLLHARGVLTLIWRADGLPEVLAALARDFGAVSLLPVYPKPGAPAIRILVAATKASRAPLSLLPGLLLARADGRPTAEAEAVLRGGAALPLVS